ncbi:hypothetical protein [Geodermatophilus chilensis]|uniref:hypothetical protein n=1 Tax=Geodermatophilus chilensis TaxID=2035835 RepID=UPI0013001036|nr:hypothetical protein [Geodermatophilus chilensis]
MTQPEDRSGCVGLDEALLGVPVVPALPGHRTLRLDHMYFSLLLRLDPRTPVPTSPPVHRVLVVSSTRLMRHPATGSPTA